MGDKSGEKTNDRCKGLLRNNKEKFLIYQI